MNARASMLFAVTLGLAPIVACSSAGEQPAAAAVDGGTGESGTCPDGEMAAILAAANQAQVDAAMDLRANLSDPGALDLAEKMLTDHSLLLEELQGAMRAGAISARTADIGRAIADSAAHDRADVAASASIDSAYVDQVVLWHLRDQALLGALVAPAVQGTRLAFVATSMQTIEKQHVSLALALQQQLDTTCR